MSRELQKLPSSLRDRDWKLLGLVLLGVVPAAALWAIAAPGDPIEMTLPALVVGALCALPARHAGVHDSRAGGVWLGAAFGSAMQAYECLGLESFPARAAVCGTLLVGVAALSGFRPDAGQRAGAR